MTTKPRLQRAGRYTKLQNDYTDLMNLANRCKFIVIQPVETEPGWPAERYQITFTCEGITGVKEDGTPKKSSNHQVDLYLSREYPSKEPSLLWLTDIWHPNIDHREPRHVCTNAVQTYFVAKPLSELVLSLAEMVQYRRYHAKLEPPFPLNLEAARWVREIAEPKGWIGPDKPFDNRPLLRPHRIRRRAGTAPDEASIPATPEIPKKSVNGIKLGAPKPTIPNSAKLSGSAERGGGIKFGEPRSS